MGERTGRLARISLLLASFFLVDKILAIARQLLTARVFGLSPELDAFNAANNLPDLLFALISGGALAIAFIPVLSEVFTREGSAPAWRLFSRVANLAFITTAALAAITAIFASQLVNWRLGIAPGFQPEQRALVAELMRLNLVATLIFSISGLVMAGLQSRQHFLLPAAAPLLYNLGQIIGAVILAPSKGLQIGPLQLPAFGLGVRGLVYGVIFGAVLHLLIQIPGLIKFHFCWQPDFGLKDPHVRRVLSLLMPRLGTMLSIQMIFIARDNLASSLPVGAVSALTYGWMILQVPETLIGTAIGTAMLPTLSEMAARQDWEPFKAAITRAIRVLTALTIPIAAILALWLRPWIALAFGFDPAGTTLIHLVTAAFLAGLLAHSVIEVEARAFYSTQNARLPLLASILTLAVFLGSGWLFTPKWGAAGIAIAVSLAFTVEMVFLGFLLHRHAGWSPRPGSFLLRGLVVVLATSGIYMISATYLPSHSPLTSLPISFFGMAASVFIAFWVLRPALRELMRL
jgi:putative peptidoglycan lipid II flippase